jgi:hypothetical protein
MKFSRRAAIYVRATLAAASLIALVVLFLSQASAEDARGRAKQACKADYSRFCAAILPGGGRVRQCLGDNYAALSPACKQVLDSQPQQ